MVVAMTVLTVALAVTFSLFERGTRAMRGGDMRTSLASDARRSLLGLLPMLRVADSETLEIIDASRSCLNESGRTVERHAFSLATLSRWDDQTRFNQNTATIYWDSYRVVYATRQPRGELVAQEYRPAGGPIYAGPLPGFSAATHLSDDPNLNANAVSTKVLCQSVDEFAVFFDPEAQTMRLTLRLGQRAGKKVGGRQLDERSEATANVRLENSGPGS